MGEGSLYRRIVSGNSGPWAVPLRGILRTIAAAYGAVINLRNRRYDRRGPSYASRVPVISVGNVTAGGTGKTPFVIELARRLDQMGRNPVVVARGYGAAAGAPGDEEQLIRRSLPGVAYLADPDRTAAVRRAERDFAAEAIVLDDGFQHRRLGRSLDIVLIDATCPFGYGHLLPRGLLREPVENLRRADVVVITRWDQISRIEAMRLGGRVESLAPRATHLRCRHRVVGLSRLDGSALEPVEDWSGSRAVLFAAVGNPDAFALTVRSLGVEVVGQRWWPDHHRYRPRDLTHLLDPSAFPPHDVLLTTEKDAVKLVSADAFAADAKIRTVSVAIDFVDDGSTILQHLLEALFTPECERSPR